MLSSDYVVLIGGPRADGCRVGPWPLPSDYAVHLRLIILSVRFPLVYTLTHINFALTITFIYIILHLIPFFLAHSLNRMSHSHSLPLSNSSSVSFYLFISISCLFLLSFTLLHKRFFLLWLFYFSLLPLLSLFSRTFFLFDLLHPSQTNAYFF